MIRHGKIPKQGIPWKYWDAPKTTWIKPTWIEFCEIITSKKETCESTLNSLKVNDKTITKAEYDIETFDWKSYLGNKIKEGIPWKYHGRDRCPFHHNNEHFDIFFVALKVEDGPIPVNLAPLPLEISLDGGESFTESNVTFMHPPHSNPYLMEGEKIKKTSCTCVYIPNIQEYYCFGDNENEIEKLLSDPNSSPQATDDTNNQLTGLPTKKESSSLITHLYAKRYKTYSREKKTTEKDYGFSYWDRVIGNKADLYRELFIEPFEKSSINPHGIAWVFKPIKPKEDDSTTEIKNDNPKKDDNLTALNLWRKINKKNKNCPILRIRVLNEDFIESKGAILVEIARSPYEGKEDDYTSYYGNKDIQNSIFGSGNNLEKKWNKYWEICKQVFEIIENEKLEIDGRTKILTYDERLSRNVWRKKVTSCRAVEHCMCPRSDIFYMLRKSNELPKSVISITGKEDKNSEKDQPKFFFPKVCTSCKAYKCVKYYQNVQLKSPASKQILELEKDKYIEDAIHLPKVKSSAVQDFPYLCDREVHERELEYTYRAPFVDFPLLKGKQSDGKSIFVGSLKCIITIEDVPKKEEEDNDKENCRLDEREYIIKQIQEVVKIKARLYILRGLRLDLPSESSCYFTATLLDKNNSRGKGRARISPSDSELRDDPKYLIRNVKTEMKFHNMIEIDNLSLPGASFLKISLMERCKHNFSMGLSVPQTYDKELGFTILDLENLLYHTVRDGLL